MTPSPRPMLEVINLSRHFGGLAALDGASFNVSRGEVVGLAPVAPRVIELPDIRVEGG